MFDACVYKVFTLYPTDPQIVWRLTVLLRIKVRFVDTVVRVEHVGQDRDRGVGVELKIAW